MTIYQVGTSTARATTDTLQYNGVFLDIPFLSCRVVSPTPIAWAIGDFITWNYDGVSYRLRDIPSASKQSTSGTYGEAFVYEDVKFYSDLSKTKGVDFLDYTPYDPTIHYSSLPNFSFYGKVSDLLARIGANMARYHADWVFTADDVESGDIYDALNEYKEINVENISCWDAIKLINSEWKIGFVYYYDSTTSKHTLVAGALGGDTSSFSYGQGNGLYIVARSVSKEDSVVTRLRAYGSSENLPSRYYNNLLYAGTPLIGESMYIPNLMIPYTEWGVTSSRPDVLKSYIDCNNPDVDAADTSFAKYGIRERSIFFDGNGLKEIKPTIENMTAGELRTAISAYTGTQTYFTPDVGYVNSDRMDLIKKGDDVTDDGYIEASTYYEETYAYTGDTDAEEITGREFYHTITSFAPATLMQEGEYTLLTDGLVVTLGNAEDRSYAFSSLEVFLMKNGSRSALVSTIEGVEVALGDLQFTVPNIDFSVTDGGDIYSLELVISATISDKDYGDTTNFAWTISAADFIYRYKKLVPNDRFTIEVRDIGFDVYKFVTAKLPAISMKTGACSGRQFRIRSSEKITGGWRLTCSRQIDDSLGSMYFPNNNTKIAALDQFVLVDLNMPDIYVEIASLRLYKEAKKWLRKNKETQYVYEPKIDEIYMALNPQVIKEGMSMPVTDTDLGIDNTVLINSVTINENGDGLRTYDVVLRDGTDETLLGYIDSKSKGVKTETVKFIVNAATPKTQSASETRIGLEAATLGYDDSLLWKAISAKEPLLPDTPINPTEKFLNGNKEWAVVSTGSSGQNKVYFTSIASDISGYKELSYNPESSTSYCTTSLSNTETLCSAYLYPLGVGAEYLDGGTWEFKFFAKVSGTAGTATMKVEVFKRNTAGVETTLFSKYSDEISNLDYVYIAIQYTLGITYLDPTDRIGVRVYGKNTVAAAITLTWALGDGDASYFTTPLAMRHDNLRDKNGNPDYQHITQANQTFLGIKTFSGAFTDIVENRNTRLRLPKLAPTSATADEYYLYATDSGFSGELPSGAGSVTSIALTVPTGLRVKKDAGGTFAQTATITESGEFIVEIASTYFLPTTTQFATKLDVSLKGTPNGLAELDENGFVKNTQLPSYVDDVLEYGYFSELPTTGTSGKIYVITNPLDTDHYNKTYRWSGTIYTEISQSLALGETSSTAYRGDRGKTAYDHSQIITGNPHGTTAAQVGALGVNAKAADSDLLNGLDGANYLGLRSFGNEDIDLSLIKHRFGVTNRGDYATQLNTPATYGVYLSIADTTNQGLQLFGANFTYFTGSNLYFRVKNTPSTDFSTDWTAWKKIWDSTNSNLSTVNWSAAKLTSTTLLLPQTTPSLASGEMAIYGLESGFSGELPSGAGSVDSVALISNLTGISVAGSPITTSGTFTLDFVSGYSIPTNYKQGEWDNAYTLRHNAVTLGTANGLSLSTQVLSLGLASTTTNGALSSTDWNAFNGKAAGDHAHDDRYYTETESDARYAYKEGNTSQPFSASSLGVNIASASDRLHILGSNDYSAGIRVGYGSSYPEYYFRIGYATGSGNVLRFDIVDGGVTKTPLLLSYTGAATFSSTISALNGNSTQWNTAYSWGNHAGLYATASQLNAANLTNGYLPYWNGSSLVNSAITNDTDRLNITGKSIKLYSLQYTDNDYRYIGTEYDNGNGNNRAEIRFAIDGGDTQTRITLHTANGNGQINEVMRANRLGNVDIGYGGTRTEKLAVNGSGYFNTTVQMLENINTNLRIPKVAPTNPTSGEYYFYIVE